MTSPITPDQALGMLLDDAHLARAEDLPGLAREAAIRLGFHDLEMYLVEYEQEWLCPLPAPNSKPLDDLRIDDTVGGRAYISAKPVTLARESDHEIWVPLLDSTDRVGVMCVRASDAPDEQGVALAVQLASLLAELVLTRRAYGDTIEIVKRKREMSLPAELQWKLLPPLTFAARDIAISAIITPCYDVGGDAFDYALDGTMLRFGIFDAMGHGLEASLLAAVALGSYRNSRRRGRDIIGTFQDIDGAVQKNFGPDHFVTGIIAEIDIRTGLLRRINAGHPAAILIRRSDAKQMHVPVRNLPFGLNESSPTVIESQLEEGDRVLMITDGFIDARDVDGHPFGLQRLIDLIDHESNTAGYPAPEVLRRLARTVSKYAGDDLQDDATALIVEWRGDEPHRLIPRRQP